MTTAKKPPVHLLFADESGNIYDHPDLLMLSRRGDEYALPRPDELIPLPEECEIFFLPGRRAVGLDPESGQAEVLEERAVAAFVTPGYTLTGHAAYRSDQDAPVLPLFAYGAVGFAEDRLWVCAKKVDEDPRQIFTRIPPQRITEGAHRLMRRFPKNRLISHLCVCALTYGCPAAKNLALGRFEAPLPTSRTCNARCVGCISLQPEDSGFPATQNRIAFTPTAAEVAEVMAAHAEREKKPVLSFGQGCEGEPLTEAALIAEAVALYRAQHGPGTVNINTNGSLPASVPALARAGVNSLRVSLNSARPELHEAYYRPKGYSLADVRATIAEAKAHGLFVSLNYLFFPGVSDTERELDALSDLLSDTRPDFIQLRNLNIDPELYLTLANQAVPPSPSMGYGNFRKRLKKACPWLGYGYFNPYLGDRTPNDLGPWP
jgi:wyosine [tRNA(Phe)-imidazoG37] synthetase (radical SAM superfamily)